MAKTQTIIVGGKSLTQKENGMFEEVKKRGKVVANDLVTDTASIYSVRSTLARLEKTHGLLKSSKKLEGEKVVTQYEVA